MRYYQNNLTGVFIAAYVTRNLYGVSTPPKKKSNKLLTDKIIKIYRKATKNYKIRYIWELKNCPNIRPRPPNKLHL